MRSTLLVAFEEGALEEARVVLFWLHYAQAAILQVYQNVTAPHPEVLLWAIVHSLLKECIKA